MKQYSYLNYADTVKILSVDFIMIKYHQPYHNGGYGLWSVSRRLHCSIGENYLPRDNYWYAPISKARSIIKMIDVFK